MTAELKQIAQKSIGLLDLTNLEDDCTSSDIEDLCKRAQTEFGTTAAICIWPKFIEQATKLLKGTGIKVATVVNFPHGGTDTNSVETEARQAVEAGVDEVDLVFPYRAFINGEIDLAADQILTIRQVCLSPVKLKVILETGELGSDDAISRASLMAIDRGADFIKTSTGKMPVSATLGAARIMLEAIKLSKEPVGFKPAGGIKTTQDAVDYLTLANDIMGNEWANENKFRFGASSLLNNLLATLHDEDAISDGSY